MVDNPRTTDQESAVTGKPVAADERATAESESAAATGRPDTAAGADGVNGTVGARGTAAAKGTVGADMERGEVVDLGSLSLRLPAGARPRVTGTPGSASHALYLRIPEGHISISVLAAPADRRLWPEFAEAISSAVQGGEGSVLTEQGEWGPEVQSGSGGELTWYIGRDGPLWLLYGTATGPAEHSARLASSVRALLREAEVRRGHESLPDKTTLPLRLPPGYQESTERPRGGSVGPAGAGAAAAGQREPELKPLPGPPAASWHPSYHGTSSTGPREPVRRLEPPDDVRGAPQPTPSSTPSQWPEWLDDPLAPEPGEEAVPGRHTRPESRGPKTKTLVIVAALVLLIGGAGTIAGLTGAINVSPRPTSSSAQPAAPAPRPDDGPPAIGLPADPAAPGPAQSPVAPLPGQLGPSVPQAVPGPVNPPQPRSAGRAGSPSSGSAPRSGHRSTVDPSPGRSTRGDSAHVAQGPASQRGSSHGVGTRSVASDHEATERRSNRRADRSESDRDENDTENSENRGSYDDEGCECDDDRSPRRSRDDGPSRHRTDLMTAGERRGPLLGLLDTALGGL
jgi:hypothetical protein